MKRLASQPITAFFQRKEPRRNSIESVGSDSTSSSVNVHASDQVEEIQDDVEDEDKVPKERPATRRNAREYREAREDLTGILQRRELEGCAASRLFMGSQGLRRRRKQQLVRWALTHFQRLPVELQLAPHWERQAGVMSSESFYASCLEFDSQGVLLAAGASNGIVALYDFDDVFHRSLNVGQRMVSQQQRTGDRDSEAGGEAATQEEAMFPNAIVHPIHTIFTRFEVKSIRWNPSNEDEIACSFSNRNEIHVFNLSKFPTEAAPSKSRQPGLMKQKSRSRSANVIAGDMDGAIRMWDIRFPMRPVWSILTDSQPITSIVLSPNKRFIICGNEAGMLMTYDIEHKIVPAFGSKPVPQRKASLNVMDAIRPYISGSLIESVLLSCRSGAPGIISIRLVPHSETQVLCQLRNDWVVMIDYLVGSVVKLHTFIRGLLPKQKLKPDASPSVLSMASEIESQRDFLPRSFRNSWLSCHRCTGTFLFDKSVLCTGMHDAMSLNVIDMHRLPRMGATAVTDEAAKVEVASSSTGTAQTGLPAVERLDRFRIPMDSIITAVAAHPSQQSVICGGENMRLQVMGVLGPKAGEPANTEAQTVKHLSAGSVSFQIGRGDGFVREKSVSSLIQVGRVEEIRPLRKYTTSIGLRANYRVEDDPILRYTATTRPNGASGVGEVEKKYGLRMGNVADDEVVEYVLRLVVGRLSDSEQVFQALKSELDFSQAYTAYGELKKMHDSRERAVARLKRVEKLRHRGVHGADSDVTAIINLMERSSLSKASRVKSLSRRLQPPTRNLESSFVDNLVDSATSGMAMLGLRATDSYEELADVYCGSFCRMCYMYACHEHGGDHPLPARRVEPAYPRVQSTPRAASGVEGVDVSAASSDDDMGYVSSEGRGNVGLAHAAARARRESGASSATSGGGDVDMSDDDRQQRRQRKQLADPSEYVDASHVSLVAAKMHSFLSTDNSCGEQCWKSGRPVDGVKQHAAVSAAELGVIRKLRETMGDNSCLLAAVVGSISCIDLRDLIDGEQNSNENGAADGVGRSGRRMRNWKHGRRSGGSNHELLQRTRNQRLQDRGTENHEYKPCMHEGMCDSTGCSCMKRDHMCEKACACSRDCPNRFEGCTCASGECRTNKCPCFAALRECDPDVCSSCGASDVAVVAAVAGNDGRIDRCAGSSCGNVNVIRSKHMRLGMSFSSIHGYGMYAREAIAANEFVYEYTGAMLSQDEAERRGLIYDKMEMSYLFDLNEDAVLDALRSGNKSKFINHSGETPNCTAKVVSVCGVHHISIWALRDIAVGEELVFDYGYKRSVGPDWSQRRAASKNTV